MPHYKNMPLYFSKPENLIALIIIATTGIAYFSIILLYAQNVPAYDDYIDIIPFIIELEKKPSTLQTIQLIFEQYNQHIIAVNRIIYSAVYHLTGKVNFYTLTLIGNINLLIISFLYFLHAPSKHRLILTSACCALLFQLSNYHAAMWPMASIANYSVISLAFLTVTFLQANFRGAFSLALLSAFFATFTLGSGQMILVAGFYMLAIKGARKESKVRKKLYIWLIFSTITIALFYGLFDTSALSRSPPDTSPASPQGISRYIYSFFALVGAPLAFNNSLVAIIIGAALTSLFIYFYSKLKAQQEAICALAFFLLASICILTLSRSWVSIDVLVATERYRIVSITLIACIALLGSHALPNIKSRAIVTLAILSFAFSTSTYYFKFNKVVEYSNTSIRGINHWISTGKHGQLRRPVWVDLEEPFQNLKTLYDKNIYTPEPIVTAEEQ